MNASIKKSVSPIRSCSVAEVLRPKPAVCRCQSYILFQAKTQIISAGEYGIGALCTKATALTKRCSIKS